MECAYHPDREAIWMCDDCGKCICKDCALASAGKIYCPQCFPLHSMAGPADGDTAKVIKGARKQKSRLAAVFLILLSALTYLPLLLTWDGESSYFMALLAVAIVSFFFQASLAVKRIGWAWWGSAISWVVDILIVVVAYAYSVDPSGVLPAVAVIVVGTPAGIFLLLGKVSDRTAIALPFYSMLIVATIILIFALYQVIGIRALFISVLAIFIFFVVLYVDKAKL
jgi:hypothetical protein